MKDYIPKGFIPYREVLNILGNHFYEERWIEEDIEKLYDASYIDSLSLDSLIKKEYGNQLRKVIRGQEHSLLSAMRRFKDQEHNLRWEEYIQLVQAAVDLGEILKNLRDWLYEGRIKAYIHDSAWKLQEVEPHSWGNPEQWGQTKKDGTFLKNSKFRLILFKKGEVVKFLKQDPHLIGTPDDKPPELINLGLHSTEDLELLNRTFQDLGSDVSEMKINDLKEHIKKINNDGYDLSDSRARHLASILRPAAKAKGGAKRQSPAPRKKG